MFNNLLDLLFLGFSTNLILSCILTITALNAVTALMALIFAFVNATCIFFLMELEFVGLLFLIVYLGAVCVLFLFSVMLFNLKDVVRTKTTSFILSNILIFFGLAITFLFLFQYFINQNPLEFIPLTFTNLFDNTLELSTSNVTTFTTENFGTPTSSVFFVGQVLYNRYLLYLILASIILLVAMLGAVVLINNPKEQTQIQHITKQMTRSVNITNLK